MGGADGGGDVGPVYFVENFDNSYKIVFVHEQLKGNSDKIKDGPAAPKQRATSRHHASATGGVYDGFGEQKGC